MYTVCLDSDDAFRRSLESNTACHSRLFGCYTPIYTLRDRFGNQYLLNSMLAAEPSGFYVDFISFSRTIDQCPDFQNHAFNPDRQQCEGVYASPAELLPVSNSNSHYKVVMMTL
jgi:hypothetical protein